MLTPRQAGGGMARHRIAIMGAGAVGCYYGALLAIAGEQVTLIGRPALRDAVRDRGLLLERKGRIELIRMEAATGPEAVSGADLVLVCVKSPDTESVARDLAPHLAPGAVVLSLQNGVGNAERLAAILGRPVLPVVVYVATQMAGPGHVVHHGRGELVVGTGPGADIAAATLRRAGIPTEISATTDSALWSKLVINCALNAISAVTRQPYGRIVATPGATELMRGVVAECLAVAQASGVSLPDNLWSQVERIAETMPGQFSSTAQDMMRGRPTEIDYLNGEIVRRAAPLGLPAPLNNALVVMVKLAEQREG